MSNKSLFEAVNDLIYVYDANKQEFTEGVRMALNALRPYLFTEKEYRAAYARVLPVPKEDT